ncbi:unnamed protein product [Nezara viridula]|uniref:Uncharacterized protein n=1 Tax=Nezara viridula TaxID=85310 RepID=A0A9P0H1Z1_NEZVI|nr:unnamed protein product [Nezara viridula]
MKFTELFGNLFLTGTATWALLTTKSSFQYDSLSYSFFLSVGISRFLANLANNPRVTRFTKTKSQNSLAFATALLSTEFCLVAGMDKTLASSNLLLPLLNLLTKRKDDEKMLETSRWYSTVLLLCASNTHDLKIGYVLTFILLLTDPKILI